MIDKEKELRTLTIKFGKENAINLSKDDDTVDGIPIKELEPGYFRSKRTFYTVDSPSGHETTYVVQAEHIQYVKFLYRNNITFIK